jgi:hypothetical protein
MIPSFGIRYGLIDGVEIGAHLQNLDSLEADAKIRLLKGTLDLAIDPGAIGRLGVGVDVRLGRHFALHPEITFLKAFSSTDALMYIFGVGFNFGAMPDYSDLDTGGNSPPPPPGQPPPPPPPPPAQ